MKHKKHMGEKKVIKLEGILKGYDIDFADLKELKQETWNHVDEESNDPVIIESKFVRTLGSA